MKEQGDKKEEQEEEVDGEMKKQRELEVVAEEENMRLLGVSGGADRGEVGG